MAFDAAPRPASRFVTIYVIFIRVRNDVSVCPSLVSFVPRGTKGSIQGKEQRTWEERVVEREAVSRRFNALLEKVFELVYERLDASRGGKCVVEGKRGCEGISSIPVSPVSSPDDNRQAPPPVNFLRSRCIIICPRIFIFINGACIFAINFPAESPASTLQSVNYFLGKLKAGEGGSCA